jgi:hypothetical protein
MKTASTRESECGRVGKKLSGCFFRLFPERNLARRVRIHFNEPIGYGGDFRRAMAVTFAPEVGVTLIVMSHDRVVWEFDPNLDVPVTHIHRNPLRVFQPDTDIQLLYRTSYVLVVECPALSCAKVDVHFVFGSAVEWITLFIFFQTNLPVGCMLESPALSSHQLDFDMIPQYRSEHQDHFYGRLRHSNLLACHCSSLPL